MINRLFLALLALLFPVSVFAVRTPAAQQNVLDKVGFVQKLDGQIPLNLKFRNEAGSEVSLASYFGKKPVILNLVYFECPMLCTEVLNGLVRTLRSLPLKVGKDFTVVTVSFDPNETPALAAKKKAMYLDRYGHPENATGWAFLTGEQASIKALADSVGFYYTYDADIKQFAHASGIMVATPEGRLSHYFFGVEYPTQDVRLSLVEAGGGKIGSPVDQLLLYCYHYDPATGRYGVAIMRVIRIAGACTALCVAAMVFIMLRNEKERTA